MKLSGITKDDLIEFYKIIFTKNDELKQLVNGTHDVTEIISRMNQIKTNYLTRMKSSINDNKLVKHMLLSYDIIENQFVSIVNAINQYQSGKSSGAFNTIKSMLENDEITKLIDNLVKPIIKSNPRYNSLSRSFYRLRVSDSNLTDKNHIFHIGSKYRHKISTQRYSIQGLPCLYLGSTIYVCWEEIGCPDFLKTYASIYKAKENFKILDLTYNYQNQIPSLGELFKDEDEDAENIDDSFLIFFKLFPLIVSCNLKRIHENANFNAEYIIPNIFLEWVMRNNDIDGIKYRSTKVEADNSDSSLVTNYVFPPKSKDNEQDEEYNSHLRNLFEWSEPYNLQKLIHIEYLQSNDEEFGKEQYFNSSERLILGNYQRTEFYRIEKILNKIYVRNNSNQN